MIFLAFPDCMRWVIDMEEERQKESIDRGNRVKLLKKLIVSTLVMGVTVPWVLCAALFVQTTGIRKNLETERGEKQELSSQIEELEEIIQKQEEKIAQVTDQMSEHEARMEAELQEEIASIQEELGAEEQETVHKVYLTFDDGPSKNTNEILDILKKYDVKATFFVLGKPGKENEAALKRIVEEGHSLGMHSYSHKYADIYASKESFAEDFQEIQSFLQDVTGVTSRLYRFPGGSSNTVSDVDIHELIGYLEEQGVVYYDWNVSSGDASSQELSEETIYQNCIAGIAGRSNSVVLLHDAAGKSTTVEALPRIIETLLKMDNVEILPITEDSEPVQHVKAEKSEN